MNRLLRLVVASSILALCSCVPSVNPLYTEKDLVFDPGLIGTWGSPNGREAWTFEQSGPKVYKLLQKDDEGRVAQFEVHLVQLKEHRFLDLYLIDVGAESEWKINQHAAFAMVHRPAHLFMRVHALAPTLKLAYLDPDWVEKFLRTNPRALAHETLWSPSIAGKEERILLTAGTRELQRFILKHEAEAFSNHNDEGLVRKPASSSPSRP